MHFMIKRRLNDYDAWKKVISELDGLRAQYGSRGFTSYRNADDPSEVYLIFEWDDTRPPEAYLELPEVRNALAATGTNEVVRISEVFSLPE